MAQRISRKEIKRDEIVETAGDIGEWLEEHWPEVLKWGGAVVVAVLLAVTWRAWSNHSQSVTQETLSGGIGTYEQALAAPEPTPAKLEEALATFDTVIERAGRSQAGQLARFYRGATLFHLGRLDEAATVLAESLAASREMPTLAATTQALLARVFVAAGRADEAISLLTAALDEPSTLLPQDETLLEIGRIHAGAGRHEQARAAWQRVVDEFQAGSAAHEARRLLGS